MRIRWLAGFCGSQGRHHFQFGEKNWIRASNKFFSNFFFNKEPLDFINLRASPSLNLALPALSCNGRPAQEKVTDNCEFP